ncbi:hypothetical protein BUW96_09570 [Achromobacter insolitus]|nr:hypothetical protein BUW96_09570 [Achromobacter insolitus]OWT58752.1 hypothetical protein CEY08_18795 [Achromobacter insolitus]
MDLRKLDVQYNVFLRAAETDDELGTVLRLHLLAEAYLEVARDLLLASDVKLFVPNLRNFADKLGYASVAGLPVPLAAVMKHVNTMRNKLAHRDERGIDAGDIGQLARFVNALRPLSSAPELWKEVERGFLELPNKYPGMRWTFGGGNLRADFLICFARFWSIALNWLFTQDAANKAKGTAGSPHP